MKITIVSGSPRQASVTVRVARFLKTYLSAQYPDHAYELVQMADYQLPFVENVWSHAAAAPEDLQSLAALIFTSDAFIVVTPEYNGSYSVAMKNLFDHFPKQSKKVFGIVTASPGAMGGMRAAQQMQNMVCGLFGIPCPNMLVVPFVDKKFSAEGALNDGSFTNSVHTFAQEFIWLSEAVSSKKSGL